MRVNLNLTQPQNTSKTVAFGRLGGLRPSIFDLEEIKAAELANNKSFESLKAMLEFADSSGKAIIQKALRIQVKNMTKVK